MTTLDEIQARADAAPTLPADARMDAYYYGFDRTGVDEIDAVLSAIAIAGKGSHHTESWGDSGSAWYYAGHKGLPDAEGAAELIEETAKQSAQRLVTLKDDNRKLVAALRAVEAVRSSMSRIADFNLSVIPGDDMGISLRQHSEDLETAIREALG